MKGKVQLMIKKGDMTRTGLLRIARELFSEKGFSAVTMKDFCERSGLSRGGLYRHYASTREIFKDMLNFHRDSSEAELEKAMADKIPARQMLRYFIQQQKQEIRDGTGRLSIAVYEFCTAEAEQKDYLDKRFASAVDTLERLIRYGQSQDEFRSCDSKSTARHIVILMEGLRLTSAVVTYTKAEVEEQFKMIYDMLANP